MYIENDATISINTILFVLLLYVLLFLQDCSFNPADIVFLLDASGSEGSRDFI